MNIQPLMIEAERYLIEKDVDRAAELYVRAQEQCAGLSPLPFVGLARIAILMQKFEEARQLLVGLQKRFPTSAETLTLLGVLEEAEGRLEVTRVDSEHVDYGGHRFELRHAARVRVYEAVE